MSDMRFDEARGRGPETATAEPAPADAAAPNWSGIACSRAFRDLLAAKKRFILPVFLFFLFYYFTLPILAGRAPRLLTTRIGWGVSLGLLLEMSQFVMGWLIAWRYVKAAARFDRLAKNVLDQARDSRLTSARKGAASHV